MLKSNLLSLGMLDMVRDTVEDFGFDFDDVLRVENDMALGNGGLGRLASCFLDCLASRELPGTAMEFVMTMVCSNNNLLTDIKSNCRMLG